MGGRFTFRSGEKVFLYRNGSGPGYRYMCLQDGYVGPSGTGLLRTPAEMFELFQVIYRSKSLVEFREPLSGEI